MAPSCSLRGVTEGQNLVAGLGHDALHCWMLVVLTRCLLPPHLCSALTPQSLRSPNQPS